MLVLVVEVVETAGHAGAGAPDVGVPLEKVEAGVTLAKRCWPMLVLAPVVVTPVFMLGVVLSELGVVLNELGVVLDELAAGVVRFMPFDGVNVLAGTELPVGFIVVVVGIVVMGWTFAVAPVMGYGWPVVVMVVGVPLAGVPKDRPPAVMVEELFQPGACVTLVPPPEYVRGPLLPLCSQPDRTTPVRNSPTRPIPDLLPMRSPLPRE